MNLPIEVIIGLSAATTLGILGYGIYRAFGWLEHRIHLMVRASFRNTQDVRANSQKIAKSSYESRKAFEHQRVLICSLNQQIRNLEATLVAQNVLAKSPVTAPRLKTMAGASLRVTGQNSTQKVTRISEIAQAPANTTPTNAEHKTNSPSRGSNRAVGDMPKPRKTVAKGPVSVSELVNRGNENSYREQASSNKVVKLSAIFAERNTKPIFSKVTGLKGKMSNG